MTAKTMVGLDSRNGRFLINDDQNGMVPPGGYCSVPCRPQLPFRGERFFVWSRTASSFLIHSVQVGITQLCASYGPVPAEMFATRFDLLAELDARVFNGESIEIKIDKPGVECLGLALSMPVVIPGWEITCEVENIGDAPARFVAGIYGSDERDEIAALARLRAGHGSAS